MNPPLKRHLLTLAACWAVSVGGSAIGDEAAPGPATSRDDTSTGRFSVVAPCPFPAAGAVPEARITCGYLDVPENRLRPAGAHLRIPVVRIRSKHPSPQADPVVFLHGGPGAAPLESSRTIERFSQHPFAEHRDIVLFNQRGSAQTDPSLDCAALSAGRTDIHAADLTLAQRDALIAEAAVHCMREVAARKREIENYGAVEAAADLRDLREALHIERWNVLAVSYGTLIALEAARTDPQGVRSLILDSIVSQQSDLFIAEGPRNFSLGLDRLLDACAADPVCAADYPGLARRLQDLLDSLERRPLTVTVAGVGGQGAVEIIVNWHDFLSVVHWMMYSSRTLPMVPALIDRTHRGDLRLLTHLMDHVFPAPRNGPTGASPAFFAFVCRDQYTSDRPPPVAANPAYRGFSIVSFIDDACARAVTAPRPRSGIVRSEVPALLLSGKFDPMTPDVYAEQAAAGLPNAVRFVVGDSGHSTLSDFTACSTDLATQFIEALSLPPASGSCRSKVMRPSFARPSDPLP